MTGYGASRRRSLDRVQSIMWARTLLRAPRSWVILDTETTGLGPTAEVIEVAVLAPADETIYATRIRAQDGVPPEATAIHGITEAQLGDAATFDEVFPGILEAIGGRLIIAYNAGFDARMVAQTAARYSLPPLTARWECAMQRYAAFAGEWSDYHGNYRYQKLPARLLEGARNHRAAEDCWAVLALLRKMAASA